MEASSNHNWRMEHRDLLPYSVYGDYVGEFDKWITWNTPFEFECAVERLVEMSTKKQSDLPPKNGIKVRYYSYRIRNIDTGEVIPGELFE